MSDATKLSAVIGAIYDAAVDANGWSAALQTTCSFLDGHSAHMVLQDVANQHWKTYECGIGEHYSRLYLDHAMVQANWMSKLAWSIEIGALQSGFDLLTKAGISLRQLCASRMCQEWNEPLGFEDCVQSTLDRSSTSLVRLSIHFGSGLPRIMIEDEVLARMRLLVPHFRRAILIGKFLENQGSQVEVYSSTLDRLATAVFLVSEDGLLVHANHAAEKLLSAGIMNSLQGRLATKGSKQNAQLRIALRTPFGSGRAPSAKGFSMTLRGNNNDCYVGHILPLDSALRQKLSPTPTAAAALFVQKAEICSRISGEVLGSLYALSPKEVRVLMAVLDHEGVREIAEALHVSEATVRTHLRHIFVKTNTHRQAELVKLVASHSVPLAEFPN